MVIICLCKNTMLYNLNLVTFSSVQSQSCLTLCDPMNHSMPGLPVHHQLLEFTQTRVHWVSDAIQPPHPLLSPSPPAPNPSQHQGLFQWVNSLHQVAKVLQFPLQHQAFQWTPRTDLLKDGLVEVGCISIKPGVGGRKCNVLLKGKTLGRRMQFIRTYF